MSGPDVDVQPESGEQDSEHDRFARFVRELCKFYGDSEGRVKRTLDLDDERIVSLLEALYDDFVIEGPYELPFSERSFIYATVEEPYVRIPKMGINSFTMPASPQYVVLLAEYESGPKLGFRLGYSQYVEPTSMLLYEQDYLVAPQGDGDGFDSALTISCWRAYSDRFVPVGQAGNTFELTTPEVLELRELAAAAVKLAE